MSRRSPLLGIVIATAMVVLMGCHPQQPFYFSEDGDLSHYKGVATEIEYPDVQSPPLGEVERASRPFSLDNQEVKEIWDLTLEEAMRIALANNKVMRTIGGQVQGPPEAILRNPDGAPTVYDPAIVESNPRSGVEGALAAFDAQYHSLLRWERFDDPINTEPVAIFGQDLRLQTRSEYDMTFQNRLQKTTATGGTFAISNDYINSTSKSDPLRIYHMDWTVQLRAEVRQPLLQGAGVQFNRIAGPGAIPGFNNGVMLARINTDLALHDFEASVRSLVSDVEITYWELYFAYRALDAAKTGRDAGARTWQEVNTRRGPKVGTAALHEEAQALQQYFQFKAAMERALTALYQAESKLRYLLGLAATDGRLIRPKDEPTTAKVSFDWCEVQAEALVRNVELRRERWTVKRRELELIAARNYLMPKLDAFLMYQFNGLGNLLLEPTGGTGDFAQPGSNAYQNLTNGAYQDWNFGLELTVPIGFRKEMAGVRNAQLTLARERARLQESELELSHQLAFALRDVESDLVIAQTAYSRRVAAKVEVDATFNRWKNPIPPSASSGRLPGAAGQQTREPTLADVLDAQRRLADAEVEYYRALIDYNKAIAQVHFRKGSLLEYNGVYLAEGPWPAKAYFDAYRRARARDAALYIDYGFTLPKVVSRGSYAQLAGQEPAGFEEQIETAEPAKTQPEPVPTPAPLETRPQPTAPMPQAEPQSTSGAVGEAEPTAGPALTAEQARTQSAGNLCDVGSLDLGALAARAEKRTRQPGDVGRPAAVKQTKYEQLIARPKSVSQNHTESTAGWAASGSAAVPAATRRWGVCADAIPLHRAVPGGQDARAPGLGVDSKTVTSQRTGTKGSGLRWLGAEGSSGNHEPVTNPPSAEADRPAASGWKGVER